MNVKSEEKPDTPEDNNRPRYISLRWRFIYPLFVVVLIVAMVGAYIVARNLGGGVETIQVNTLLENSQAVTTRASALYDHYRQEAQRVAFTVGVAEAIRAGASENLDATLEGLARIARLDSIILTDPTGLEVIGVQRVDAVSDYAVSTGANLNGETLIGGVVEEGYVGATQLLRTSEGMILFCAVPVNLDSQFVGIALVGQRLESVLSELQGSAAIDIAFYGDDGALFQTTFAGISNMSALTLAPEVYNQALGAVQQVPIQSLSIAQTPYQAAYFPFNFGPDTLGVISLLMPDNLPFTTQTGRQSTALLAAALAGAVVIAAFVGINRVTGRLEKITRVTRALAVGQGTARTGMHPGDEVGVLGNALDQYATYVQEKHDELRTALRRQRREVAHLLAVFESLPDGAVVQDLDGRVILMNDQARQLLGSQRVFRSAGIHELTSVVTDVLGPSIAPGLYALGDPQRIDLDGKMLSAQAAAVMSATQHRLGTVILLHDITDHVRQEQSRDEMLGRLMKDIQEPLAGLARAGSRSQTDMVNTFAREITRHAVALQKMIVEMRDLSGTSETAVKRGQLPIRLETLIWAVANEWRQIAQAGNLTLHVIIERKGLYVLGDERRLRWALGSIVDNAIKYTPPGGALTLEIQEESGEMGRLRVRDNGAGISRDDLPNVFTRFFRGTPVTKSGRMIHVPGMGQGLTIARQIFEAHGGSIRIKSNQNVGTAVYMSLPLTSGEHLELPYFDEADMDGETMLLNTNIPLDVEIE